MRPRVLFLAPRFPWPLDRGDRIRAHGLLEQFSRVADVTLATLHDRPATEAPLEPLERLCRRIEVVEHSPRQGIVNMLGGIVGSEPFQVRYFRSAAFSALVDRLAREPWDLVVAQLFRMRPYLDRFPRSRRILELSDSLTTTFERAATVKPPWTRWLYREEARRVRRYEAESLDRVEESWVVAEPDRRALEALRPGARVVVVPMGIDPRWHGTAFAGPKEPVALFLGNLTVGHNRDAAVHLARDVWPLVRSHRPDARLLLTGRADAGARRLAAPGSGIVVTGFVDDLGALFARATLAVAPLRFGAGIQNKVLDSMAAGLPCVVTPMVGRPIGAGREAGLVEADTTREIADAIAALLEDPDEAGRLGRAAHDFARRTFGWERAGERMRELLAAKPTAPPPTPTSPSPSRSGCTP